MPEIGQAITVELPDERTRAEIVKVVSDSAVLARIIQFTTAYKSHPYKKGDTIGAQLKKTGMGQMAWIAIDERAAPRPAEPEEDEEEELADAAETRE